MHPYLFQFLSLAPFMPAFLFSNLLCARYHTYDLTLAPACFLCQLCVRASFINASFLAALLTARQCLSPVLDFFDHITTAKEAMIKMNKTFWGVEWGHTNNPFKFG